jgi:hypothetical protein
MPDYPLKSSQSRGVRDWPPYHTPEPKVDHFPYRSKPGLARQLTGGRDPWPMRSKLPDVGWMINSKYPKPGRAQPQPSQRVEQPYVEEPFGQMEAIPYEEPAYAEPYVAEPVPQELAPAPRPPGRRDPYTLKSLNHDIGRFVGSAPARPDQAPREKRDPYTFRPMTHDPTTFVGDYESRTREPDEKTWNMGESAAKGRRSLLGF